MSVKNPPVIALTTDFGLADPFAGIMKGVILGICPDACVVDVTHGVPPQDVLAGFLALEAARPYFPPSTIHVAVVDPGVGTARRALAVFTERDVFVAPDNGLLSFLREDEIQEVRSIVNPTLALCPVSRTFHGRDVFAPAAAHLAKGVERGALGPTVAHIVRLPLRGARTLGDEVHGEVLHFDHFGNAVTTIREADLPEGVVEVQVGPAVLPWAATYGDTATGAALAVAGSSGRLELSVNGGSARESLGLGRGDRVVARRRRGTGAR